MVIELKNMYIGETAEIISINSDIPEVKRLRDVGLMHGRLIELLHYDHVVSKKIIVMIGDSRIAFDISVANAIKVRPLKSYYEVVRSQAMLDNLTNCMNRNYASCMLTAEHEKFVSKKVPLSVLLADIDCFKKINDTYGHQVGDKVLKNLALLFKQILRRSDVLCRWGGEEFLILLRGTLIHDALQTAERLRQSVESYIFPPFNESGSVTVSIGGCGLPPDRDVEELIGIADSALYEAKHRGRNRVSICGEK